MSVFNNDSWEIEEGQISVKNFIIINTDPLTMENLIVI